MPFLEANHLTKNFQQNTALSDVSFAIAPNKIYGLLGPNGAGKTTLIRLITQIFMPDAGEIKINGEKISDKHTNFIGYMPEERGMYKKMKVGEHLIYFAKIRNFNKKQAEEKINYWLKKLDIESWRDKTIDELSKGMQQKVQFIATVLHDPKLLILDEPFSGLDPIASEVIKNEIFELHQKGTTILFSTHRMENVEEICEDILLINKGKIILDGNVHQIKQQFKQHVYRIVFEDITAFPAILHDKIDLMEEQDKEWKIRFNDKQNVNDVVRLLLDNHIVFNGISEILPTVNEIFIEQVNKSTSISHEQNLVHYSA